MAWVRVMVLALLWAGQAAAQTSVDDLRALIVSGYIPSVEAAVQAADAAPDMEFDAERALHPLFGESSPAMTAFLQHWLEVDPGSAPAMVAMGWHLYYAGLNMRGTEVAAHVWPAAMDIMMQDHQMAMTLAERAIAADPSLVSASDLRLRLTVTLGRSDLVPIELERIMALRPNRGSLMRGMGVLAPQWGGKPDQVRLLCERYASKITSVPGYDAATCEIDAVYFAGFWPGQQREEAHRLLEGNTNPVLDYARLEDATAGRGTAQQRIALLEQTGVKSNLTVAQTYALAQAKSEVNDASWPAEKKRSEVLARELALSHAAADQDPYSPKVVINYLSFVYRAAYELGIPADRDDEVRRLHALISVVPYNPEAWAHLADMMNPNSYAPEVDLDAFAAAEPYFANAIVYSNHDPHWINQSMMFKLGAILAPEDSSKTRDIDDLSPEERARLDAVIHCPLFRQIKIKQAICQSQGIGTDQCFADVLEFGSILQRLQQVLDQGACKTEVGLNGYDLAYSPIKITFPPAP